MPGPVVNVGSVAMCPHAGQVQIVSSNVRVMASGTPIATAADTFLVVGCAFTTPPPLPCISVQWIMPATRVLVNGIPPVLQTSTGIVISATGTAGPPIVASTQPRVVAT